jgi:hypothetical protein
MLTVEPAEGRHAVEEVLPRFTDLLRHNRAVTRRAVGSWGVAEVACHVSHVLAADTDAIAGRPLPAVERLSTADVAAATASMLDADPERDVRVLADRIDVLGSTFLDVSANPPAEPVGWIGGVQLPASAVICHLLEELLVHGFDVSRAARARWTIEPAHAALAIAGAAVPIIASSPQTWAKQSRAAKLRARVEIRARRHNRFVLVFDDGLSIEAPPSQSSADAYFSAKPDQLLLFLLGRKGPWRMALTGNAIVWGRRPHVLLKARKAISPP